MAPVIPEIDLTSRVVYFPIRHFSPACAWHVTRLIEEMRPDAVLIEGPRDATALVPLLVYEDTRMPVAIYTTYVQRRKDDLPARHSAYYPFCDYSPEFAAIRAGIGVGAKVRFIDLTYPEMVESGREEPDERARSLLSERYLKHSTFLRVACQRAGLRDPDDLWDHLYEDGYTALDTADFMRNVLTYCALAREDYTEEMLESEGCIAREAGMAACVAEEKGRTLVVTGGFHTVALPGTRPKMPKKVQLGEHDAETVLIRYSFQQLDRLNGYASGMPSPAFYQRLWEGKDPAEVIVELGRKVRETGGELSSADEIAALAHSKRLANLRGHGALSREDLLDGIRSVFIKGSEDVEGVVIMTHARNLLAGERVGEVPAEAGQPPIVHDFRDTAARLRLNLEMGGAREAVLDLYRKANHRESSRFFHRLDFLEIPFGTLLRGPDFVTGEHLERIQEVWEYVWSPHTESTLIERSLYGATLEEAASSVLLERFASAETAGQGRRADIASALLLEACRMGLHKYAQDLLERTAALIAEDGSFTSLVRALADLLVLHVSREPLEADELTGLENLAVQAFDRACYLLPSVAALPETEETEALDALNAFSQMPGQLPDTSERRQLLHSRLSELANTSAGSGTMRGAACGLLFDEGLFAPEELVEKLRGSLISAKDGGAEGVSFLRGLLATARSVLWQLPEIVESVTEVLSDWEEENFVEKLPSLRLAFADLTPRECDRVARTVAADLGLEAPDLSVMRSGEYSTEDLLGAAELNRRVLETLRRYGLEDWVSGDA